MRLASRMKDVCRLPHPLCVARAVSLIVNTWLLQYGMSFFLPFFGAALGFELRASHLLGRH
jgi:hypothetical protein